MVLLAYRHGFRASEVCGLEWSAIDFARAEMHVSRRKAGKPATHPIRGDELRELRKLRKESTGSFVFVSGRGAPFTPGLVQLDDQAGWSKGRAALPGSCPHAAAQRRLQARR
jgi:integrase